MSPLVSWETAAPVCGLLGEPQFSALPYPYAKKGQPSNRLAVFSRFQGCSAGGKLPMVSWETAAAVCGLLGVRCRAGREWAQRSRLCKSGTAIFRLALPIR